MHRKTAYSVMAPIFPDFSKLLVNKFKINTLVQSCKVQKYFKYYMIFNLHTCNVSIKGQKKLSMVGTDLFNIFWAAKQ